MVAPMFVVENIQNILTGRNNVRKIFSLSEAVSPNQALLNFKEFLVLNLIKHSCLSIYEYY